MQHTHHTRQSRIEELVAESIKDIALDCYDDGYDAVHIKIVGPAGLKWTEVSYDAIDKHSDEDGTLINIRSWLPDQAMMQASVLEIVKNHPDIESSAVYDIAKRAVWHVYVDEELSSWCAAAVGAMHESNMNG